MVRALGGVQSRTSLDLSTTEVIPPVCEPQRIAQEEKWRSNEVESFTAG